MEIMLVHYYHQSLQPLRSISRDIEDLEHISCVLKTKEGKAFRRFQNMKWYMKERAATEEWLLKGFVGNGGLPQVTHPVYFVVGESKCLEQAYGKESAKIQIPFDQVATTEISFTLEDSMGIHVSGGERRVFSKESLLDYIQSQGVSVASYLTEREQKGKYIEAQIWSNLTFNG